MRNVLALGPSRGFVLLVALALGCAADPRPEPTGLNVLVVSFDALRADALGAYGYPRETSPNIDAFAERAIVFERAYSAAPVTPTSFAASWSGHLPHRVFRGWKFVPEQTLGEIFSAGGYRTAGLVNNVNLAESRGFARGFGDYRFQQIQDPELFEIGTAWLREHADETFFLWLHFISPHAPYHRLEMAEHLYDPSYKGRFEHLAGVRFEAEGARDVERIRSLYDGEVFLADTLFGRLLEELERLGRTEDTVVVLTADHGEEFLEHGGFQHKFLYEEVLRVPLMILHPGRPGGQRVSELVSLVDLLPTLVEIAGLEVPPELDGSNILGSIEEGRMVISEAMTSREYLGVAARRGRDKLIVECLPQRSLEYYDLGEDPLETHDRSRTSTETIRALLSDLRSRLGGRPCSAIRGATRGGVPTDDLDPQTIEELRALGYLD